jgi:hypothetical protein
MKFKVISKFLSIDFHILAFRGTAHIQSTAPPGCLNKMGKYRFSEVIERQLKIVIMRVHRLIAVKHRDALSDRF